MAPPFNFDQLQGMPPGNMNSALLEHHCRESTAELVDLGQSSITQFSMDRKVLTHPIYESPIPTFNKEWKLAKKSAEQSILEDGRIGTAGSKLQTQNSDVALAPGAFLRG